MLSRTLIALVALSCLWGVVWVAFRESTSDSGAKVRASRSIETTSGERWSGAAVDHEPESAPARWYSRLDQSRVRRAEQIYGKRIASALAQPLEVAWERLLGMLDEPGALDALAMIAAECDVYASIDLNRPPEDIFGRESVGEMVGSARERRFIATAFRLELEYARERKVACGRVGASMSSIRTLESDIHADAQSVAWLFDTRVDPKQRIEHARRLLAESVPSDLAVLAARILLRHGSAAEKREAMLWLTRASDLNGHAAFEVAECAHDACLEDIAGQQDPALNWLELAAAGGSPEALDSHIDALRRAGRVDEAERWIRFAEALLLRGCHDGSPIGAANRFRDLVALRSSLLGPGAETAGLTESVEVDEVALRAARLFGC